MVKASQNADHHNRDGNPAEEPERPCKRRLRGNIGPKTFIFLLKIEAKVIKQHRCENRRGQRKTALEHNADGKAAAIAPLKASSPLAVAARMARATQKRVIWRAVRICCRKQPPVRAIWRKKRTHQSMDERHKSCPSQNRKGKGCQTSGQHIGGIERCIKRKTAKKAGLPQPE